jgi:hypothetical protein
MNIFTLFYAQILLMARFGYYFLLLILAACGSQQATPEEESAENYGQFSKLFQEVAPPYTLSDSALLNNKDTAQIRNQAFLDFIPDSVSNKVFGNKAKVRYTPMARFDGGKNGTFYLVKGASGNKRAAFLVDKNLAVTRNISKRPTGEPLAEGKDVFAFSTSSNSFELVMTDPLDDLPLVLVNPIDTLARTHKLAGDYQRSKNNLVSVRDGRKEGLLTVFIHISDNDGACTGEIKGDAELVGPNQAVFRQAGNPCILNILFTKNGVTLEEQEGCGSKRGLECRFDGNYPRKKEAKAKKPSGKKTNTK